ISQLVAQCQSDPASCQSTVDAAATRPAAAAAPVADPNDEVVKSFEKLAQSAQDHIGEVQARIDQDTLKLQQAYANYDGSQHAAFEVEMAADSLDWDRQRMANAQHDYDEMVIYVERAKHKFNE
ncbi:MAG: hypothetical protein HOV83_20900, partial [Catenulispora sp.]|nr:hypothetical protein [Catenulispora sp.]